MIFEGSKVNLYYEQTGSGQPLIMLHGNGEDHRIFDKAKYELERHFTVYLIDTRGHGQSSPVSEYHYEEMAEDIYEFINGMGLEKPVVYGFSDGGIMALLLAIRHPDLLSKVIVSGVNCTPQGIDPRWRNFYKFINFFKKSPLYTLMLTEPNITSGMLKSISVPVFLTGGMKDMIKLSHLQYINNTIPNCKAEILVGENHSSYVVHSTKIARYILDVTRDNE